ncbi:MAG: glycosyltransferase family 8 protein [Clostridium sp.]|nr:glycosyltransferase family 8 protein [Clostridium sp.]
MADQMNILYQFNEAYAPFAGASVTSLFENNRRTGEIVIYILGEGLSAESIRRFEGLAEQYGRTIIFLDADAAMERMKEINLPTYRGSYAANLRLFLTDILPESVERILYLDADTVVCNALDSFYMTDMGQKVVGMVIDSLAERHKRDIGLSTDSEYYNSGVILFNMKKWRRADYTQQIVDHVLHVRSHYPAPDQDLLNVCCRGAIFRLPIRYNLQPIHLAFSYRQYHCFFGQTSYYGKAEIEQAVRSPGILHFFRFVGEFPWHENTLHPDREVFDKYLALSPWRDYQKKKAQVGAILKIEKGLYRILPRGIFIMLFKLSHMLFIERANRDSLKNKTNKNM